MITIKEMANMLGTSTTTVSNVIHGKTSEVSQAMVQRVEQMLEEYDYVPNISARNLAQNKSKIIGVAMKARKDKYENFMKDPFTGELVGSIEAAIRAKGYFMMIYIAEDIMEILKYVSTWNVDGLILLGMLDDESIKIRKKYKKPAVYIDGYFYDNVVECVNIGLEDKKGGYDMTRYLIQCGHRKIAFLADNCIGVDYERFMGYRQALEEENIKFEEEDFIMIRPGEGEIASSLNEIYRLAKKYTAFFCVSDYYAAMVMNYLKDKGMKIPRDISIVGFDDNLFGRTVRPALTTVHQNVSKKGKMAVDILVDMIHGKEPENRKTHLPTRLVIRDSVKKLTGEENK
ncbi:MAG: LacI family DNA-binding transcriptional regulator [Lachnospiraceae bacterium]|nr:LacI family transcriptional regulator [Robinsoniella sp.]MDY3766784.1 LacI family DNA-binding transcriptional regulator [Lachnospiraceae bacterium]